MPEPERPGSERPEPDEFDAIVRRLGIHLSFPDDAPVEAPRASGRQDGPEQPAAEGDLPPELAETDSFDETPDARDEQFYRRVEPRAIGPVHRGRALAWIGLVGSPLLLMLATLAGSWLSSSVLLGAGITFVASAIYLISQLPEHGPSQPDWPDDGAEL